MSHVRRIALAAMFGFAVMILGLVIDTAVFELLALTKEFNVSQGPFAPIPGQVQGIAILIPPLMFLGLMLWIVWGSIQEERQEEARTRVRRR